MALEAKASEKRTMVQERDQPETLNGVASILADYEHLDGDGDAKDSYSK
jgi:hypothetical protein